MVTPDEDLKAALLKARTLEDFLSALARVEYRCVNPDKDWPSNQSLPTPEALAEWLSTCQPVIPETEMFQAIMNCRGNGQSTAIPDYRWQAWPSEPIRESLEWNIEIMRKAGIAGATLASLKTEIQPRPVLAAPGALDLTADVEISIAKAIPPNDASDDMAAWSPDVLAMEADAVIGIWRSFLREGERPSPPLAPLIRAWLAWKAQQSEPTEPFTPKRHASLPEWNNLSDDEFRLSDWPSGTPLDLITGQHLIDLDDTVDRPWLLDLYMRAGGPIAQGGRLPFALTLAVGAMVHLPIDKRDGIWRTLRFPHTRAHARDPECFEHFNITPGIPSIEEWIYGEDGFPNPGRDWKNIADGLCDMREKLSYLRVQGFGFVAWAFPSVIPETRTDPFVEFSLRIPRQAARGSRMDWPLFQRYASERATVARAYLSAVDHMGKSAHRGMAITRQIPAPVLGPDDRPKRRKGGRIVRSKTQVIDNRHARYVRGLTESDLAQMCGWEKPNRNQRRDGRNTFERLHDDGVVELFKEGDLFRVFGPDREAQCRTAQSEAMRRAIAAAHSGKGFLAAWEAVQQAVDGYPFGGIDGPTACKRLRKVDKRRPLLSRAIEALKDGQG